MVKMGYANGATGSDELASMKELAVEVKVVEKEEVVVLVKEMVAKRERRRLLVASLLEAAGSKEEGEEEKMKEREGKGGIYRSRIVK